MAKRDRANEKDVESTWERDIKGRKKKKETNGMT